MVWVYDAEQLTFKKLDESQVIWRTIRGNRVPIPKYGTKEQKAESIKQWFAAKNKELPKKKKTQQAVYSAKFEHEKPKIAGTAYTGEGASVHTHGQYTQNRIDINKARYFEKFAHPRVVSLGGDILPSRAIQHPRSAYFHDVKWTDITEENVADSMAYNGFVGTKEYIRSIDRGIKKAESDITYWQDKIKKLESSVEAYKEQKIAEYKSGIEKQEWAVEKLKRVREIAEQNPNILKDHGYKVVPANYFIGDKPVFDPQARNLIQKIYAGAETLEGAKDIANRWGKKKTKEIINSITDVSQVRPAKAQMSKVSIPAEKYFLDENKRIWSQSKYVKSKLTDIMIQLSYFYVNRFSGSIADKEENFAKWKQTDGYKAVREEVEKVMNSQGILWDRDKRDEARKTVLRKLTEYREPLMGENEQLLQGGSEYMQWGHKGDTNWNLERRLKQENIGNIAETEILNDVFESMAYHGKNLWDNVEHYVAGTRTRASKIFHDAGIVGSTYWGGTDKRGHVLFNVNDIKTIEKTTDRDTIKKWIHEQKRGGKGEEQEDS